MPAAHLKKEKLLERISTGIITSFEKFFYNWGYNVANNPVCFICGCLAFTGLCSIGLLGYYRETQPDKLWVPWNSEFVHNTNWLKKNFPSPIRFQFALVVADDVLDPHVFKEVLQMHKRVENIQSYGKTMKDICFKLPVVRFAHLRRRRSAQLPNNDVDDNYLDESVFDDFKNDLTFHNNDNYNLQQNSNNSTKDNSSHLLIHNDTELYFSKQFDSDFDNTVFKKNDKSANASEVSVKNDFDPSAHLPRTFYCEIVDSLKEACWERNILELWSYDTEKIQALTKEDILHAVNNIATSPVFGFPSNFSSLMGGIMKNSSGHIIGAKALWIRWYNSINMTAVADEGPVLDTGLGEVVDRVSIVWEKKFLEAVVNYNYPPNIHVYGRAWKSFSDVGGAAIVSDAMLLAVGYTIVFIYVALMLGQFNMVEQRPICSTMGLLCIVLAIFVAYGTCSAFGLLFGPIHNALPFLFLGIGIDDMFVIVQCWNNIPESLRSRPLAERVAIALKHAGVSITVTSLTDFMAFIVGSTTVLPALKSFCIYAACGILATYFFQATFFVAWFSIEQRRIEKNRNSVLCCIKHKGYVPNSFSQKNIMQSLFYHYSKLTLKTPFKIVVLIITACILGVSIWGNLLLEKEFDPMWFLPQDSYLFKYGQERRLYFPSDGEEGLMSFANVNFSRDIPVLDAFVSDLASQKDIIEEVDDWYSGFKGYVNNNFHEDIPFTPLTSKKFNEYMSLFLHSPSGAKYRYNFKVNGNITCSHDLPPITVSRFFFKFRRFHGPEEQIPAMHRVKEIVARHPFSNSDAMVFPWAFAFSIWETDEVIGEELYRNVGLAMVCVFICTLVLIADFRSCVIVLCCVAMTLVDVMGLMHFWGLTIDTVSCIGLVLAIGLSVDYAAHVAHTFMKCIGTRDERVLQTLKDIGPAVFNGGFSTFLAFLLLVNSKSHVFMSFFKIFVLVVSLGLYHGLVFLPVILTLIGPKPYETARANQVKEYDAHYSVVPVIQANDLDNMCDQSKVLKNTEKSEDKL